MTYSIFGVFSFSYFVLDLLWSLYIFVIFVLDFCLYIFVLCVGLTLESLHFRSFRAGFLSVVYSVFGVFTFSYSVLVTLSLHFCSLELVTLFIPQFK